MNDTPQIDYDINRILFRPLTFGLVSNVVVPMGLLMICYYVNNHGGVTDKLGESAGLVFYLFCGMALAEIGLALWLRQKSFSAPMIRRRETFEHDFAEQYSLRCRPIFLVIASISVYGYLFYWLTGQFNSAILFVVLSFLVFQLVRPRHGLVYKLIERQQAMIQEGKFLGGPIS